MSWKDICKDFVRVNSTLACPVCGHHDGCLISRDGAYAVCYHVQSDKLCKMGYLHPIVGCSDDVKKALSRPYKAQTPVDRDWDTLNSVFVATASNRQVAILAEDLGVSPESLRELCIGWSSTRKAYTFPVRGSQCQIVGIQTRQLNGQKKMIRGSCAGVFIPCGLTVLDGALLVVEGASDTAVATCLGMKAIGQSQAGVFIKGHSIEKNQGGVIFITEGASDTATALTIGLNAVGRFNAVSTGEILMKILNSCDVHVIADNSGPEIQGASQLVQDLRPHTKSCNMIVLPFCVKDLRCALNTYGREATLRIIQSQMEHMNE